MQLYSFTSLIWLSQELSLTYSITSSTKSGMHFIVYCAKFILLMKSVNIRLLSSVYYSNNNFELTLAMHNQNIVSSSYHHRHNPDLVKLNYQIKSKYHCCNLYITTCCVIHMNMFAFDFGQEFILTTLLLLQDVNLRISNMIELRT